MVLFLDSGDWKKMQNRKKLLKSQWCLYMDSHFINFSNTLIYLKNNLQHIYKLYYLLTLEITLWKHMDSWNFKVFLLTPYFPFHIPHALSPRFLVH